MTDSSYSLKLGDLGHRVTIRYCAQCKWLLRSAWMAQELLSTFEAVLVSVSLEPVTGGVFEIWTDNNLLWSRKRDGGFPEIPQLKRLVRDAVAPEMFLGHRNKNNS